MNVHGKTCKNSSLFCKSFNVKVYSSQFNFILVLISKVQQ